MANYADLKAAIAVAIKYNDNHEITGEILQNALIAMIESLGAGCQFAGVATPETNPGTPDQNVVYIAGPGTYPNFDATVVPRGSVGIFRYNGSWVYSVLDVASWADASNKLYYNTQAGNVAAKTIQADGFTLQPGGWIKIHFDNANEATNPTLNVNNTGAHIITFNGRIVSETNSWKTGETVAFYYDNYGVGIWHGIRLVEYSDFINVNDLVGQTTPFASASAARSAISQQNRKLGLNIIYLLSTSENTSQWVQDMFIGNDVTDWSVADNWKTIGFVSVSQNSQTGHTDINIGKDSYHVVSVEEFEKEVMNIPRLINTEEVNVPLKHNVSALQLVNGCRYDIVIHNSTLTDTDIDNLDFIRLQLTDSTSETPVYSYEVTTDDKANLKNNRSFSFRVDTVVTTSYINVVFAPSYAPGSGKKIILSLYILRDLLKAVDDINNGEFADKSVKKNSNRLITSGGVYNASIFENVKTKSFSATSRFTTTPFDVESDIKLYIIKVQVSGLSDTDIDNLKYFRVATGTGAASYVFSYTFSSIDKNAFKSVGYIEIPYTAEQDSTYIHLYFNEDYTPTSGNEITVTSILALTCNEVIHRLNNGTYADKTPTQNSNHLITSDGVFKASHIFMNVGKASFVMEGRYNNKIGFILKSGYTYLLRMSVSGLSDTDIDNLSIFRVATGTGAASYVFSYDFTSEDKASLKNDGYCLITYIAVQDTNYFHLYFVQGYDTPTEGNVNTIIVSTQYELKDALSKEVEGSMQNFLSGKNIVLFGDSITEFVGRGEGVEPKRYSDYIEEYTGANCINVGIGGTHITQRHDPVIVEPGVYNISDYAALDMVNMVRAACGLNYNENYSYLELAEIAANQIKLYKESHDDNTPQIARLAAIDWSKVDYVTILGGTNDWNSSVPLGTSGSDDVTTVYGAINEIIRILLTTYPHIKLIWLSPTVRWVDYDGTEASKIKQNFSDFYQKGGITLKEFSNSIKNEVILNHIPICDLYNKMGWNMYNFAQYFGDNPTHPFRGNAFLGRVITNFIYSH